LVGEELLMLQGIPVDDLLLTKETEDNLKDLAGNAMSTTVVGACTLCALLVGYDSLPEHDENNNLSTGHIVPSLVPRPLEPVSEITISQKFGEYEQLTLDTSSTSTIASTKWNSFLQEATLSAKMCVSEGQDEIIPVDYLAQCQVCGHTSSFKNAFPPRKYEEHEFEYVKDVPSRVEPALFRKKLLDLLPMRVNIVGIELNDLKKPPDNSNQDDLDIELWQQWLNSVRSSLVTNEGSPIHFRLADVVRTQVWTALYESQSKARLEVKISKNTVTWFMFAKSPTKEGPLKALLARPFARMHVGAAADGSLSMLSGQWEVCLPITTQFKLYVQGIGKRVPSWRNRLGLKGEFEHEYQFETLRISCEPSQNSLVPSDWQALIEGDYVLLPKCGGACGSLRRKINDGEGDSMFFFLSSGRSTLYRDDVYVISPSFHRTSYGEYRETCLEIEQGFDPNTACDLRVQCSTFGKWMIQENAAMKESFGSTVILIRPTLSLDVPLRSSGWEVCPELLSSTVSVDRNEDIVYQCLKLGGSVEVNLQKSKKILKDIAFATSRWTIPDIFSDGKWLALCQMDESTAALTDVARCEKCAPLKPRVKWTLVSKGKKSSFVPLEDGKEAAIYERALKARPKPWLLRIKISSDLSHDEETTTMNIQVGCNVTSLVQRAFGLFPMSSIARYSMQETHGPGLSMCSFDWRVVLHTDSGTNFSKLSFTSNKQDSEAAQPPRFHKHSLRKEQLRSLTWMLQQESSTEPYLEEEAAEAILPSLNWRIEGRVRRPVLVRGGIIADEVGYGKTAITLGLIDSAESVNGKAPEPPVEYRSQFIYTNATLVIVPKHLMGQWPNEVEKFLGKSKKICVIKDLSSMNNLRIEDIQRADIVIVSFAVLNNETYFSRLARFSGVNPESFPKGSGGGNRQFAAVYNECLNSLPCQIQRITQNCADAYRYISHAATSYDSELPGNSLLLDGKKGAYKNTKATTVKDVPSVVKPANADKDPWGLSSARVKKNYLNMKCPPLEMFFWQRLVVDE
jgi:SNF2-related domain